MTDIEQLEQRCVHTTNGIPQDIFLFFSRHVPMVNVDLIIKDEHNRTLLSWRDDECGTGWHVPGGAILLDETIADCMNRTAMREIGVILPSKPLATLEMFMPHGNRRHCISLAYKCFLSKKYNLPNHPKHTAGYLKWHNGCPNDLITVHEQYRNLIINTKVNI